VGWKIAVGDPSLHASWGNHEQVRDLLDGVEAADGLRIHADPR